jgi:hypothetical protein
MRCAIAFGAKFICVVGSTKFSTHGAHEAKKYLPVVHFYYWQDCIKYLREQGCGGIFGVSSTQLSGSDNSAGDKTFSNAEQDVGGRISVDVDSFNFSPFSNAAFIVSDRTPLTEEQLSYCDTVLHVSCPQNALAQYVHYDAKFSICLLRYTSTFKAATSEMVGEKYVLPDAATVAGSDQEGIMARIKLPEDRALRTRKYIPGSNVTAGSTKNTKNNDDIMSGSGSVQVEGDELGEESEIVSPWGDLYGENNI